MSAEPPRRKGSGLFGGGGHRGAVGRPVEKARDFKGALRRLAGFLRPYRGRIILALLLSLASTSFSIAGPKILGLATTNLAEGVMSGGAAGFDFVYIGRILLVMLALYLASCLCGMGVTVIMTGVSQRAVRRMRDEVKRKFDRLPVSFFDGHPHGDLLSRVTNDVDNVAATLQQNLTQIITSSLTVAGVLTMMTAISPPLVLIAVGTLPFSVLITAFIAKRSQKQYRRQQKATGDLSGHIEEMFSGHTVVRLFGLERSSVGKFRAMNSALYDSGWKAQFMSGVLYPSLNLLSNIGYVLVCLFGGVLAAQRALAVGDVQAFILYMRHFTTPILQTANIINVIQSAAASAERVFELLNQPEESDDGTVSKPAAVRGDVRMSQVGFRYDPNRALIEDVSLFVRAGQTAAIVGPTGAGKTTLVGLLMRFYDISGGVITIDGVNVQNMSRSETRSIFGMVLQDAWLASGTIRDNIAFGRPDADFDLIRRAAVNARAAYGLPAFRPPASLAIASRSPTKR